ncbi:MAG: ROK family glucokinase [Lachnospiraceae bacterium]|nr:ROK family glucokinase [Lachnospiraceae bacterium]
MKKYGFGVDVGGTTCKLGLFQTDGTLVEKWEIPTDKSDAGKNVLGDIAKAIDDKMSERSISKDDVEGIGIGVPGAVTSDGVVNRCVNVGWGVVPLVKNMEEITGMRVRAANDANIAALGEYWMGAGKGYGSILMVTLGTGIGGGIVIDGKILVGSTGSGAEIGHIVVDEDEPEQCNCGHHGCIEQYASATGIVMMAHRFLESTGKTSTLSGDFSCKDVLDAAKAGDEIAQMTIHKVFHMLGLTLGTICNVANPEAILIGGGVSKAGQIILDELTDGFKAGAFHACANTKIELATLGNDAGIYGGVKLVME